jgi:hypothetical protein
VPLARDRAPATGSGGKQRAHAAHHPPQRPPPRNDHDRHHRPGPRQTTPDRAWELISDFEGVWEPSNPDHDGTKVLDTPKQPIRDGLRWWQSERVWPFTGELTATVHDTEPGRAFSWTGHAVYDILGLRIRVEEGYDFRIELNPDGVELVHRVWARFPPSPLGWTLEHAVGPLLRFKHAAHQHTLVELRYFTKQLEKTRTRSPAGDASNTPTQVI